MEHTSKNSRFAIKAIINGKEILLVGGDPIVTDFITGKLHIVWPLQSFKGTLVMDINERQIKMKVVGDQSIKWFLDLSTADHAKLPFKKISPNRIDCQFEGTNYVITTRQASFSKPGEGTVFRISPTMNSLTLNLSQTN